jgi:transposase
LECIFAIEKKTKYITIKYRTEMQRNKISFKGQKIFIGIDVHAKTWEVAVLTESGYKERHPQKASAKALFDFLKKHFPDGEYHAVYESGFSGFATYYALKEYGIDCVITHAADVPTTQYEEVMKTDKVDAAKLARSLRAGEIKPIYIREKDNIDDRAVIRIRKTIQKQLSGYTSRVKHMLHCNGVELPERFLKPGTHWSRPFINWLKKDVKLLSSTRSSLDLLIKQVETIRLTLLDATRAVRRLGQTDRYKDNYELLKSIPGIGTSVAMCILTEIYDVKRFRNENQFASYLGLIPTCHNSGEKTSNGEKTFRGNKHLGPMIIEAAWVAIYRDYGLGMAYAKYKQYMKPQEAIVKIARKMSNIIFSVLKNGKRYEPYKWDEK